MIEWNEKLMVGVQAIDDEHKAIIDKFNDLYEKMRIGKGHDYYGEFLEFLIDYVDSHLEHEEAFQEEIIYPDLDQHKTYHDDFRKRMTEIRERYKEEVVSNKDLIEINLYIKNWLVNHIMTVDQALADFSKRMNGEF